MEYKDQILAAYKKVAAQEKTEVTVKAYSAPENNTLNQFTFFVKPEATDAKVDTEAVLGMMLQKLTEAKCSIDGIRVLGGAYLAEKGTMGEHYGVISKISQQGASAITQEAKNKLNTEFKDELKDSEVIGAHQLLAKYPDLTPYFLRVLSDNIKTTRLAGGTYLIPISLFGQKFLVLNAFHPYQLVPFTTPGQSIIVFAMSSPTPFEDLRGKVCGVTTPQKAAKGSIRAELLARQADFKLEAVSQSSNGCHMSAGPLEGMVELCRFFAGETPLAIDQTSFGGLLAASNVSAERIAELATNPDVTIDGETQSAFDATEEKNADVAAASLAKST